MTMAYMPGDDLPVAPREVVVGDQATADTIQEAPLPVAPASQPPTAAPAPDTQTSVTPAEAESVPALTEVDVELLLSRDADPSDENLFVRWVLAHTLRQLTRKTRDR